MKVENEKKRSKVEPMFDFSIRKFLKKISAKCVMSLGADNEVFRYFRWNYLTALIFCILFHQGKSMNSLCFAKRPCFNENQSLMSFSVKVP